MARRFLLSFQSKLLKRANVQFDHLLLGAGVFEVTSLILHLNR